MNFHPADIGPCVLDNECLLIFEFSDIQTSTLWDVIVLLLCRLELNHHSHSLYDFFTCSFNILVFLYSLYIFFAPHLHAVRWLACTTTCQANCPSCWNVKICVEGAIERNIVHLQQLRCQIFVICIAWH